MMVLARDTFDGTWKFGASAAAATHDATSSRSNQRTSASSSSPSPTSIVSACAMKPTISEHGKSHGCDATYRIEARSTLTPASSRTSRTRHSSSVSPKSRKPERVEYLPSGHAPLRPSKQRPCESVTSTMIAASSRGRWREPQLVHCRIMPLRLASVAPPHCGSRGQTHGRDGATTCVNMCHQQRRRPLGRTRLSDARGQGLAPSREARPHRHRSGDRAH
mmetsp:Transcript_11449/g.26419  ORF Transcript_11449/g.26419 Transcript_11449/m.26419 type:complete len:220 (-) Transcript_11449:158-817(-)